MDFEKRFLRNGFGVGVKENYRKCYTKGVEVNAQLLAQKWEFSVGGFWGEGGGYGQPSCGILPKS